MDNEVDYAINLLQKGFIKKPNICKYGNSSFDMQYDCQSKTSHCIFICKNVKCRNRLSIRSNSFYKKFSKLNLRMISKVIKCFLRELNDTAWYKYIKDELKLTISFETVEKIYNEIWDVIVKYYNVVYQSEIIGPKDSHKNIPLMKACFLILMRENNLDTGYHRQYFKRFSS